MGPYLASDEGFPSSVVSFAELEHENSKVRKLDRDTLFSKIIRKEFLTDLSKGQIIQLQSLLSKERKRRYRRKKETKYGNINKGFTEEELRKFLKCCKNPKAHLAFFMMANLGLRSGEVVKVKLEDIDLARKKLAVQTEKAHTGDALYLHDDIREKLKSWIDKHYDEIQAHDGYILYTTNVANENPHVTSNWLRNEFREVAILAGLNEWYAKSDEAGDRPERKLYRLTTHSLRHYFITRVYKSTKDPIVASKLARHTDLQSTQVYIHAAQHDLDSGMSSAFEKGLKEKQREQEEFQKLLALWRAMR